MTENEMSRQGAWTARVGVEVKIGPSDTRTAVGPVTRGYEIALSYASFVKSTDSRVFDTSVPPIACSRQVLFYATSIQHV